MAHFTRITDNIAAEADFDRNKILITTHPQHRDVWFWTIPFGDNTCSLGVVGTPDKLAGDSEAVLKQIVAECPNLVEFFKHSEWENGFPYRSIQGYSANVKALHGKHFALLGNAAEFIDPVFSSGVTIALHSAKLAADLLARQLKGEAADWQREFAEPLMVGVNAFRTYVDGWYDNRFQNVGVRTQPRARNQPHDFRHSRGLCVGYGKPVCRKIGTAAEHAGGTGGGFGV